METAKGKLESAIKTYLNLGIIGGNNLSFFFEGKSYNVIDVFKVFLDGSFNIDGQFKEGRIIKIDLSGYMGFFIWYNKNDKRKFVEKHFKARDTLLSYDRKTNNIIIEGIKIEFMP